MKLLWFLNIPLPAFSKSVGENSVVSGGWLHELARAISIKVDYELHICFPYHTGGINLVADGIHFHSFRKPSISLFEDIIESINPDLVHIHGTEFFHALLAARLCSDKGIKFVVSIQGLVSVISKHIGSGIPWFVYYGFTPRNILKRDSVFGLSRKYKLRGEYERETIGLAKYIVGRTEWDKACCYQINKDIHYFSCNEILRSSFYSTKWSLPSCERHSIFFSQAKSPLKGFHQVIKAISILRDKYPDLKLYVAGDNILDIRSLKGVLKISFYNLYVLYLLKKFKLQNHVVFTSRLCEKEMCKRYLKSHVFVSASSIENESNSLSEAKILGVPSVSSYVGGVADRTVHDFDGFSYQHDAYYMLAHYVDKIFSNNSLANKFSINSIDRFKEINNREKNISNLINIYNLISK